MAITLSSTTSCTVKKKPMRASTRNEPLIGEIHMFPPIEGNALRLPLTCQRALALATINEVAKSLITYDAPPSSDSIPK